MNLFELEFEGKIWVLDEDLAPKKKLTMEQMSELLREIYNEPMKTKVVMYTTEAGMRDFDEAMKAQVKLFFGK